jgi:hypothetical protein
MNAEPKAEKPIDKSAARRAQMQGRRTAIRREIDEERRQRAAAALEGRPFDRTRLAALKDELESLADADQLAEAQEREDFRAQRIETIKARITTAEDWTDAFIAASAEAEGAAHLLAAALAKREKAALAIHEALAALPPVDVPAGLRKPDTRITNRFADELLDVQLSTMNRNTRAAYIIGKILSRAIGQQWLGPMPLLFPGISAGEIASDWAAEERRVIGGILATLIRVRDEAR